MPTATSNFLVPNATFIVELVAFLIVLAVVGKYVLPILNQAVSTRIEKIRGDLAAAEEARTEAVAADDDRRAALDEARHQAREIIAQANRTAEQVQSESQSRGQAEYERLLAAAHADVLVARERALEEAAAKLGEIVVDVVESVIRREVDAATHRDLIDEAVRAISAEGAGSSAAAAAGTVPPP